MYYLRWLHRILVGNATAKWKKAQIRVSTVLNSLLNNTVEGTPIMGAVVEWFGGFARGVRQLKPYGDAGKKTNELKPGITTLRRRASSSCCAVALAQHLGQDRR